MPTSTARRELGRRIDRIDRRVVLFMDRYGHFLHRWGLGALFLWFGMLKFFGHETTTSIIARTVWFGQPEAMVIVLGVWEVVIGVSLMLRPLVRVAVPLLALRLPGIVLAMLLHPEECWEVFPFAPTPSGQYLLKDFAVFLATLAIAAGVRYRGTRRRH